MRKINSVLRNYTSKGSFEVKNVSFLVIDDQQINFSVERDIKYMFGIDVDIDGASDGLEEKILRKRYDIIFIDYSLKTMDCQDMARKIRDMGDRYKSYAMYFSSVPIIVLIGSNALGIHKIVLGDGIDDFIPVPVQPYYLDRILKKWIPGNKRINVGQQPKDCNYEEEQDIFTESRYYDKLVVDGIDMDKCMNRCHFNKANYINFLNEIYKKGIMGIEAIEKYIKHGDMSNFIEQVHGLKNFSKEIGAYSLYEIAKTSEIAAYSGDYAYVIDRVENLLEIYYHIVTGIADVITESSKIHNMKTDKEKLPISYMECQNEIFVILKYLDDIRPQAAIKSIIRLRECRIDEKMEKELKIAESSIEDMDYEKAIYHLSYLLKSYAGGAL